MEIEKEEKEEPKIIEDQANFGAMYDIIEIKNADPETLKEYSKNLWKKESLPNHYFKQTFINNDEPQSYIFSKSNNNKAECTYTEFTKLPIEDEVISLDFLNDFVPEDLTNGQKGVIKYTMKEGSFPQFEKNYPEENSMVKILYEGRKKNGELLDKYRNRNQERKFKLFKNDLITGIQIGIKTMKMGEIAWFKLTSDYHYTTKETQDRIYADGKEMKIENEDLFYKIELIEYKNIKTSITKNTNFEELNFILEEKRVKGNEKFETGNIKNALDQYTKGINIILALPKDLMKNLNETEKKMLDIHKVALFGNGALCCMKLKMFNKAEKNLKMALKIEPKSVKNLQRIAFCMNELNYFEEAQEYYKKLVEIDNGQKDFYLKKIEEVLNNKKKYQTKEQKKYETILQKMDLVEIEEKKEKKKKKMENEKMLIESQKYKNNNKINENDKKKKEKIKEKLEKVVENNKNNEIFNENFPENFENADVDNLLDIENLEKGMVLNNEHLIEILNYEPEAEKELDEENLD